MRACLQKPTSGPALAAADRVGVTPQADATTNRVRSWNGRRNQAAMESRRELADIGVTVVKFSNGVEAWLKPTDFKNDQVLFTAYANGGSSLASKDDYFQQAALPPTSSPLSGLGGIKALDLDKMLAGRSGRPASPFIGSSTHGIWPGRAGGPRDGATIDVSRHDGSWRRCGCLCADAPSAQRSRCEPREKPGQAFSEKVEAVNTSNHFTSEPLTAEKIPRRSIASA